MRKTPRSGEPRRQSEPLRDFASTGFEAGQWLIATRSSS
jgi:hypothetical protein